MRGLTTLLAVLLLAGLAYSQVAPEILWQRTYGGTNRETLDKIIETKFGGFAFGGDNGSVTPGDRDFWLAKITASGEMTWSRTYPHPGQQVFEEFDVTADDGYILVGTTAAYSGYSNIALARVAANGDLEWYHDIDLSPYDDYGTQVRVCPDGGYLIAGYIDQWETGVDALVVKTNEDGEVEWSRTYGGEGADWTIGACVVNGGGYALAGYTWTSEGGRDMFVVRIDEAGEVIWSRTLGETGTDLAESIQQCADGSFIVAGSTDHFDGGSGLFVVKLDANGNTIWTRTPGGQQLGLAMEIRARSDGYFVVGMTRASGDGYVAKISETGEFVWSHILTGAGTEWPLDCELTSDGGYVMVGWTTSTGHGNADGWVVRLASDQPTPPERHFTPVEPTGLPYVIVIDSVRINSRAMETGGEIAVYDGDLCVGATTVESWPATITAWQGDVSNSLPGFVPGHPMSFRIWDPEFSLDVDAAATYSVGDGTFGFGSFSRAYLSANTEIIVTMPLYPRRFELISFAVDPGNRDAGEVFGALSSLQSVYRDNGGVLIPPDINTIGSLAMTAGYRVFCTEPETLRIAGTMLNAQTEYELHAGRWNWMGYPFAQSEPVTQALASIAEHVQIIQNDAGQTWIPSLGINTLQMMTAGEGYMIMVDSDVSLRFTQVENIIQDPPTRPGTRLPSDAPVATGLPYLVVVHLDPSVRVLGAKTVSVCDGPVTAGKALLEESGEDLVITAWQGVPEYGMSGFTPGHPILVLLQDESGAEIPTYLSVGQRVFGSGGFAEMTLSGVEVLPNSIAIGESYPNPFNPSFSIDLQLVEGGPVEFTIFNALGQTVFHTRGEYPAGASRFYFSTDQASTPLGSGLYFTEIKHGGRVYTRKAMLLR